MDNLCCCPILAHCRLEETDAGVDSLKLVLVLRLDASRATEDCDEEELGTECLDGRELQAVDEPILRTSSGLCFSAMLVSFSMS